MSGIVFWPVVLVGGTLIIRGLFKKDSEQQQAEELKQKAREEIKEKIINRKDRVNYKLFDASRFWNTIDDTFSMSSGDYKNQLGLLKDRLRKLSPDELEELDNLVLELEHKALTWDLYAASNILLKSGDNSVFQVFISMMICRGEVFFNNVIHQPDILIGKSFNGLCTLSIRGIIADLYYRKTHELISIPSSEEEVKMKGEPWTEKELPQRFESLWDHFM